MLNKKIDTPVSMEQEDGAIAVSTYANGGLSVSGPTQYLVDEGEGEEHVTISFGHSGEAVDEASELNEATGDYGYASVVLDMDQVEELYWALNDIMYNEETESLFDTEELVE